MMVTNFSFVSSIDASNSSLVLMYFTMVLFVCSFQYFLLILLRYRSKWVNGKMESIEGWLMGWRVVFAKQYY